MSVSTAAAPELRNYRYLRPLGSGGFSDVFLYEQLRPRREVAIKVLRGPASHESASERQRGTEADLMATVSRHPYIVTVLDADVAPDGREYIVMEYYPGQSLAARLRQGPLSTSEVLRIGIQLCGAVETAHRHGIVHRDIKPANVLTDAYNHPKLTDFGIAGRRGERGDGAMSPPWSPPEVVGGGSIPDEKSDVYSLAATLWHLLAGRSPFEDPGGDNSAVALRRRIEHDAVPWIGRQDVPATLERVLHQALSKKPASRLGSALALARALQSVQQEIGHQVLEPEIPQDVTTQQAMSFPPDSLATAGAGAEPTDVVSLRVTAQPQVPAGAGLIDQLPEAAPDRSAAAAVSPFGDADALPGLPPLADTQVRAGDQVNGESAPSAPPDAVRIPQRPGRAIGTLALALGMLLAATGVVVYLARDTTLQTTSQSSVSPSAQDVLAPAAPPPVPTGSARRVGPDSVEFTWSVSDPKAVAFYVIRRTDAGTGERPAGERITKRSYLLTPVGADDVPCLDVRSGAKNGATSPPVRVCL